MAIPPGVSSRLLDLVLDHASGRQGLLDCQKIAPGETLLQRLAQEIGGVKRR
jgi:hypothetical protein